MTVLFYIIFTHSLETLLYFFKLFLFIIVCTVYLLSPKPAYIFKVYYDLFRVYFCLNLSLLHICNHFMTSSTLVFKY